MITNLIINGGFENGTLLPFLTVNASIDGTHSHSGLFSASLFGGIGNAVIVQEVPVSSNQSYELFASLAKVGAAASLLSRLQWLIMQGQLFQQIF